MPKKKRGKSHSTRPVTKRTPNWIRYTPEEVEALIIKLAKDDNTLSKIGLILRDKYGIPLVKPMLGKSILKVLKENELEPDIPEDLRNLLTKAEILNTHLDRNKQDKYGKRSVQITESRIRKLGKYYINKGILPQDWKYTRKNKY